MAKKRIRISMLRDSRETAREHALIYRKARAGQLALNDAARYSVILGQHRNILESTQTEDRLSQIEERIEKLVLTSSAGGVVTQFKKPA